MFAFHSKISSRNLKFFYILFNFQKSAKHNHQITISKLRKEIFHSGFAVINPEITKAKKKSGKSPALFVMFAFVQIQFS